MNYKVVLLEEAKNELKESIKWYNQQKLGLGKSFYLEVKSKIIFLQNKPFSYSVVYRETRSAIVNRFPFRIHFRINEEKKEVVVFGVFHTGREPLQWKGRVK